MKNLTLLTTFFGLFAYAVHAAEKPNILFFLVDDMGSQDTSVPLYVKDGEVVTTKTNKIFKTPNMERLAKQGRRFSNAYAYSVCSPSRVSIMTGMAAVKHGVTTWTHPQSQSIDTGKMQNKVMRSADWNKKGIPENVPLLTTELKKAGYTNLFAGKAHFGPNDTKNGDPLNLDFEVNIAGHGAGGPGSFFGKDNFGKGIWHVPGLEKYHGTDTHLSDAITIEMNKAIENAVAKKKPFFSYMSHYAVHAPFQLDPRFAKNYPNLKGHDKAYATLVEGMDKSLGDMLDKLDELSVAEDTLVIFYSDNGSARMMANGHPYRGMKGHRHEGGHRVPLLVSWAKLNPDSELQKKIKIMPNSIDETLVTCMDMMPTFLDVADVETPKSVDGFSFLPQICGEKSNRVPEFITHFPHGQHNNNLFTSYRYGDWRVIYNYQPKTWELYDLKKDISEKNNLAKEMPEKLNELARKMLKKLEQEGAKFPVSVTTGESLKPTLN